MDCQWHAAISHATALIAIKTCDAVNKETGLQGIPSQPEKCNLYVAKTKTWKSGNSLPLFPSGWIFCSTFSPPQKNEKQNYALQTVPGQQAQKSLKNPENGCFLTKTTVFHWSEWRDSNSRHPGPKGRRNIFSDSFRPIPMLSAPMSRALRTSCLHRFQVLRTGLWSDMWSNTASRLVAAIPATNREAFSSSTGIVPPLTMLCNWFL